MYIPDESRYDNMIIYSDSLDNKMENNLKEEKNKIDILTKTKDKYKIQGIDEEILKEYISKYDYILIEADGAKEKIIKEWNLKEPVILSISNKIIGVTNIKALGGKIKDVVHREEIYCEREFSDKEDIFDVEKMKKYLLTNKFFKEKENNNFLKKKYIYINGIETLKEFKALGFGHVGGSMSVIETLAVLYKDVMNIDPKNPLMRDRDFMVMSKGHAGPAVYATLAVKGYFPIEELQTLNKPHTNFPSHTDRLKTVGVDMTTGSLGQGVSSATGIAMANKIDGLKSRTFAFVGDGELNEGQCWEAAMFAAHHKLDRLTVFVDHNKKQLDGTCEEIMNPFDLAKKYESFGFHTVTVDGHDIKALLEAIENANLETEKPSCIVLNTIKGNGCSFVSDMAKNHSVTFNGEQIDQAIAQAETVLEQAKNA